MSQLVAFPLEDGSTIIVEVNETDTPGGLVRAANADDVVENASQTFEQAVERVKPAIAALKSTLMEFNRPQELEIEFGISIKAEAGVVISKAGAEANFKIKMAWKNEFPK